MSERNSPSPDGRQPIVKKITGEMHKYANVKGKDNEKFTLAVSKQILRNEVDQKMTEHNITVGVRPSLPQVKECFEVTKKFVVP
jgi:hypothetical protein